MKKRILGTLLTAAIAASVPLASCITAEAASVDAWTCDFDYYKDKTGYFQSFDGSEESYMQTPFDTTVDPRTGDNSTSITGLRAIGINGITANNAELTFCAASARGKTKLCSKNDDKVYGAFYVKLNSDKSDNDFALGVNAVKNYNTKNDGQTVTFTRDTVSLKENQYLVMSYDNITYVGDTSVKNGYTTVAFKSSSNSEIVSYTVAYDGTNNDNAVINDIKIGGAIVDGTIKDVASIKSGDVRLNSLSDYIDGTTKNGKVKITMAGDGTTTFSYTTPSGTTSIFSGTVTDTSLTQLVLTAYNDDSARMYCIDNLATDMSTAVATVTTGGITSYYSDLAEAVEAAGENGEVNVIGNCTADGTINYNGTLALKSGATLTLGSSARIGTINNAKGGTISLASDFSGSANISGISTKSNTVVATVADGAKTDGITVDDLNADQMLRLVNNSLTIYTLDSSYKTLVKDKELTIGNDTKVYVDFTTDDESLAEANRKVKKDITDEFKDIVGNVILSIEMQNIPDGVNVTADVTTKTTD